jgi:hypothetical protein
MTPGATSLEGTPPESATTDTENFAASRSLCNWGSVRCSRGGVRFSISGKIKALAVPSVPIQGTALR